MIRPRQPTLPRRPTALRALSLALAVVATGALFASIAAAFQRDGRPYERAIAAERACADHAFVSEREACVRATLESGRRVRVARLDGPDGHAPASVR
jgi:hypothetical protein